MRALALFLLLAFCLPPLPLAQGAELLILESSRSAVYSEALRGFRSACRSSEQTVVLSDYAEVDVQRLVKEERPRVVVAIGDRALAASRKVRELPVVAMLSLNLGRHAPDNIGGISMTVAPREYLNLFQSLGVKRVGLFYDPKKSGQYVKRAQQEARQEGVTLLAEPVRDPRDLQAKLERMKGEIDALWMLPDATVATTVNMEALLLFSMTQSVPMVTFTSHYLKNGAAAALDLDPADIGVQAGELASSLLKWETHRVPVLDPRKTHLKSNESVLRKLRLRSP
ncbi:ABC transporter substrate-binding protein [Citrifermentans bremense]|uniref:ABC transporter substrate-binding protein n=1 Tax=Citrifermentans bremense TaxID=60035 RepID=UPI0004094A50|nr:ABC transporter substrate binding protein [Citrifermentans bremense]